MSSASSRVWTTRGVIGFIALVTAYWVFDYSAAINIRRSNPELAYRLRATDPGDVAGAMNDRLVVRNQFRVQRPNRLAGGAPEPRAVADDGHSRRGKRRPSDRLQRDAIGRPCLAA